PFDFDATASAAFAAHADGIAELWLVGAANDQLRIARLLRSGGTWTQAGLATIEVDLVIQVQGGHHLLLGDFDGDGELDALVGTTRRNFAVPSTPTALRPPVGCSLANPEDPAQRPWPAFVHDYDGDGLADLIAAQGIYGNRLVYIHNQSR